MIPLSCKSLKQTFDLSSYTLSQSCKSRHVTVETASYVLPIIYGNVPNTKKDFVLDRIRPDHESASFYFMLMSPLRISDPYTVTGLRWTPCGVCVCVFLSSA